MHWPDSVCGSRGKWGLRTVICAAVSGLIFSLLAPPIIGQEQPPIPTKNQAMIQVLTSETTDPPLRLQQAQALLQDPESYPALIQLFEQPNRIDTKIILCQAIASLAGQTVPPPSLPSAQTKVFIDPLLGALYSGHEELSRWAGKALAAGHDGIVNRLTDTALDPEAPLPNRLAAIQSLQWIPNRNAALILAALLDDPQPVLAAAAEDILRQMLDISVSVYREQIKSQYLPLLQNMTDQEFLQRQLLFRENQLSLSRRKIEDIRQSEKLWQSRYFRMLDGEFEKLPDEAARLNYLQHILRDQTDESLRLWALQCIDNWCSGAAVQTGPAAASLVELLTPYISDPQEAIRFHAITSLGKLVNASQPVAPNLQMQLSQEQSPPNQAAILDVLGTLVYLPAVEAAVEFLDSPHPAVAAQAARALGKMCSAPLSSLTEKQVISILQHLAGCYKRWPQATDIRKEVILAMAPIGAQEKYRAHVITHFDAILKTALRDSDQAIRRSAVQALAALHRHQALPTLLQEQNLLNDPSPAVRFAVIDAIKNFGGIPHLTLLRERLSSETNVDTAESLRGAFLQIVSALPLSDIFSVTQSLANASSPNEQLLFEQAVLSLWEKITQAKTAGQAVDPAQEIFALKSQADLAVKHNQIPQAMKWYESLLNTNLVEEKKDLYRLALIQLALQNREDDALNENPRREFQKLFPRPASKQALDLIEEQCRTPDPSDESQILRSARILADWIVPLKTFPDEEIRQKWTQRVREVTLLLIERGEHNLDAGKENPALPAILPKLDPRLTAYPLSESPEKRKEAWRQYRQIVQPSPAPPANAVPPTASPAAPPTGQAPQNPAPAENAAPNP